MLGIEHSKSKMVGAALSTSPASAASVDEDGEHLNDRLDKCARTRTSRSGAATSSSSALGRWSALKEKQWGGYAGGDAPASSSRTATGARTSRSRRSALTPGRRGATERDHGGEPALALGGDPGHGLCMGEIFYLKELATIATPTASTSSSSAARR